MSRPRRAPPFHLWQRAGVRSSRQARRHPDAGRPPRHNRAPSASKARSRCFAGTPPRRSTAVLAAALVLGPGLAAAAPVVRGEVPLERCLLHDAPRTRSVTAQCGRIEVPENYDVPDGKKIELFVAVLPARRKVAARDAFTAIAGGPGGASTEDYVAWGQIAFDPVRSTRDIVLVDQRGTGSSNRLDCPDRTEDLFELPDLERLRTYTKECLAALPSDPRHYTTTVAVRDLETVRARLGYAQLSVYGVSYGTRVALEYLRQYPEGARAVVLDGVLPADEVLGPRTPLHAQRANRPHLRPMRKPAGMSSALSQPRGRLSSTGNPPPSAAGRGRLSRPPQRSASASGAHRPPPGRRRPSAEL